MSISSTSNKVKYEGNGSTTEFSFSFKIFDESDLKVIKILVADGAEEELTLTTDYSVDFTSGEEGGTVTLVSTISSDYELLIKRELELTQELVIPPGSNLPEKNFENAYDKNTMLIQQVDEKLSRAVLFPEGTDLSSLNFPTPSAGKALLWNADGDGLENSTDDFNEIVTDAEAAQSAAEAAQAAAETAQSGAESSASAAATSESNAATSESNAADSASAASTSETNAATSATNAAASESAASISESNAATSSTEAATSATNAATSESNAADSESAAATSESNAASSASAASTSAANAALSEAAAATSASEAASAAAASQWSDVTYITNADSPVTITDSDSGTLYSVDTSSGAVVFNLPSIAGLTLSNPWVIGIKKSVDSANAITINADGTDEIDGEASAEITDFRAGLTFVPDTDAAPDEWTTISFGSGSSSGGGSLRYFYQENMESVSVADFNTDNGVIGTGGSTFAGTLALETNSPLSGLTSLKYTQATGSEDDYIESPLIPVPLKFQSSKVELSGAFSYTGNKNEVRIYVWDETNSALVKKSDGTDAFFDPATRGGISVNLSNAEEIKYIIQVVTENDGAILLIDDVEIQGNPDRNIDINRVVQSLSRSGSDGRTITGGSESIPFGAGTDSVNGWTYGADGSTPTTGNYYSVKSSNSVVDIDGMLRVTSGGTDFSVYLYLNGAQYRRIGYTSQATSNIVEFSYLSELGEFSKSDKLSFVFGGPSSADLNTLERDHYLNIVETASSNNVIVAGTNDKLAYEKYTTGSGTANTSISAGATEIIDFNIQRSTATKNITTGASWRFTATRAGEYDLNCSIYVSSSMVAGDTVLMFIYKNGSSYERIAQFEASASNSYGIVLTGSTKIELDVDDYIDIRVAPIGFTLNVDTNNINNNFSIKELPSEDLIYAYLDESVVGARYTSNDTQTVGASLTYITFEDKVTDSNDAFNVATGEYTVPVTGFYQVNLRTNYPSTGTSEVTRRLSLLVNGMVEVDDVVTSQYTTGNKISEAIYLKEGTVLRSQASIEGGSTLSGSSTENTFSIYRIR